MATKDKRQVDNRGPVKIGLSLPRAIVMKLRRAHADEGRTMNTIVANALTEHLGKRKAPRP